MQQRCENRDTFNAEYRPRPAKFGRHSQNGISILGTTLLKAKAEGEEGGSCM
jgi:hypothetical protein